MEAFPGQATFSHANTLICRLLIIVWVDPVDVNCQDSVGHSILLFSIQHIKMPIGHACNDVLSTLWAGMLILKALMRTRLNSTMQPEFN